MRRDANSRLRIVVTGLVGLFPVGGVAWDYLQYVIGLQRLGHDVCYHEDTGGRWPYDPVRVRLVSTGDYSASVIGGFFDAYAPELAAQWHSQIGGEHFGMTAEAFERFASEADLFLNVSGGTEAPACLPDRCVKVFLDTDPGYNQIVYLTRPAWSEKVDLWRQTVDAHDVFCTYAENIGAPDCLVPRLDREWVPTRMPVVMDLWSAGPSPPEAPWTTVMTWNAFEGPLLYNGVEYGSKGWEFPKIEDLPQRTSRHLAIAMGCKDKSRLAERNAGWELLDGPKVTLTPKSYQEFLWGSRGEVSTAKNVYVALRTGWFSCRSACYLASGRPVVLQDTGFTHVLPASPAVAPFEDAASAAEAIERIEEDYEQRSGAAREYAAAEFGAERVLGRLIEDCFAAQPSPAEAARG